jgi:hypothetical protein
VPKKKYYHLKVAQDVKDSGSKATIYGSFQHVIVAEFLEIINFVLEAIKK